VPPPVAPRDNDGVAVEFAAAVERGVLVVDAVVLDVLTVRVA
jgi:hypothetical protein